MTHVCQPFSPCISFTFASRHSFPGVYMLSCCLPCTKMLTEPCRPKCSRVKHGCTKTALKMHRSSFIYLIVKTAEALVWQKLTAQAVSSLQLCLVMTVSRFSANQKKHNIQSLLKVFPIVPLSRVSCKCYYNSRQDCFKISAC